VDLCFDHHTRSNRAGNLPGVFGCFSHLSAWDTDTEIAEDLFGLELVYLHIVNPYKKLNGLKAGRR
jgi:hypothetical protein